jgi:hypothetical protein
VSNTDNVNSIVNYICKYWDYFRLYWQKTDKGQTRPLVREGAPKWQDSYFKKKRSLVKSPRLGSTPRHTDWLTVSCNVSLTLTDSDWEREWVWVWVSEWVRVCESVIERVSESASDWMRAWVSERVSDWTSEWESKWVSNWVRKLLALVSVTTRSW